MKPSTENFEDRYGSADFEQGKGANLQKLTDRKEKTQMKRYGVKSSDTLVDTIKKVVAEEETHIEEGVDEKKAKHLMKKLATSDELPADTDPEAKPDIEELEAMAKEKAEREKEEEKADKEETEVDPKEELRIKLMQYLNPRILQSQELKDYVNRSSLKEEIYASLSQIANHKLSLYKVALASSIPVELSEGKKENKEKSRNVRRQIGTSAYIKSLVPSGPESALQRGRMVMNNPKLSSQKIADLYRKLPSFKTPETIRAEHDALHAAPVNEEVEQLDEANRNPNVIKQGRTKVVKARIRKGKVQRRKRVSAVKGYTIRGGKLKRMSVAERLRRKRGQRRGKIKRKAKMARALMRRKRSMRRRASLGLKE